MSTALCIVSEASLTRNDVGNVKCLSLSFRNAWKPMEILRRPHLQTLDEHGLSWPLLGDASAETEQYFCNRRTLRHCIFLIFVSLLLETLPQDLWPCMSTSKTYFVTCCRCSLTSVQFVGIVGRNSNKKAQSSFTKDSLKQETSPSFPGYTCHLNSLSTRTVARLQVMHTWQQLRWCAFGLA